jgi:hypothetical protein
MPNDWFGRTSRPLRLLVYGALPGVLAHELTHALAAPSSADVSVDWTHARTRIGWADSTSDWRRGVTLLAPTLLGWITLPTVCLAAWMTGLTAPLWVLAALAVNAIAYVNPLGDLDGIAYLIAAATGEVDA